MNLTESGLVEQFLTICEVPARAISTGSEDHWKREIMICTWRVSDEDRTTEKSAMDSIGKHC